MHYRPQTYQQWRHLYTVNCNSLGSSIAAKFVAGKPLITRYTYQLIHRIYRIELRLYAEAQAGTTSFCLEILKLMDQMERK